MVTFCSVDFIENIAYICSLNYEQNSVEGNAH